MCNKSSFKLAVRNWNINKKNTDREQTLYVNSAPDAPAIVPVDDPILRFGVKNNYGQAPLLFEDITNLYEPYYRQSNLAALAGKSPEELIPFQFQEQRTDVYAALDYYFANFNQGRPFILGVQGQLWAETLRNFGHVTYYLFPNNQSGGRNGMVCKSSRPDGPFEVCNWSKQNPNLTDGVLAFDPAVFVDDDGRVYGYWGFERSFAAEFDPTTMATVKPGTKIVEDMISGRYDDGIFSFFEASSIRKIKDKYVFIYSRFTKDGEFGLPVSNYTLAYAYSDNPLGPFTYGGTIIDARGREVDEQGNVIASATIDGNTHGSICEINGQWYVFYHRQTGTDEYARQAMVAPITVKVEEGKGGKVEISEGEYNSEGFSLEGLDPLERHSAGIACWYTGPEPAVHDWPNNIFSGSYVASSYGTDSKFKAPYALENNTNYVVKNTDGSIVGYKYFNFSKTAGRELSLSLNLIPEGVDGSIIIMADRPWASQGGKVLGKIELKADMPALPTDMTVTLPALSQMTGKHTIFFVFKSGIKEKSLCTLCDFIFK